MANGETMTPITDELDRVLERNLGASTGRWQLMMAHARKMERDRAALIALLNRYLATAGGNPDDDLAEIDADARALLATLKDAK